MYHFENAKYIVCRCVWMQIICEYRLILASALASFSSFTLSPHMIRHSVIVSLIYRILSTPDNFTTGFLRSKIAISPDMTILNIYNIYLNELLSIFVWFCILQSPLQDFVHYLSLKNKNFYKAGSS